MKQTTKRFLSMIGGLVFFVSSFIVYLEFISPAYSEVQGIKSRETSSRLFLVEEQDVIEKVRELIGLYQGQIRVQETVSMALPSEEEANEAIAQIYGLSRNSGVSMLSIAVSGSDPEMSPSGQSGFSLQKPVGKVSFGVRLEGGYEDYKEFLSLLETNIRIFDVTSLEISQQSGTGGELRDFYSYNMNIAAYYQAP